LAASEAFASSAGLISTREEAGMNDTAMVRRDLLRLSRFLKYIGALVGRNVLEGFELTEEEQNVLHEVAAEEENVFLDNGFVVVDRSKSGAVLARSPEGEFFKTCRTCGELLPLSAFTRDKSAFAGFSAQCKQCFAEAREKRSASLESIVCPDCKKRKPVSEFSINRRRANGYQLYCKECAARKMRDLRVRLKHEH